MRIFSLHIEGPICKTALTAKSKNGWTIEKLDFHDPATPLKTPKQARCISGLDSGDVVLRELELELSSKQAILKLLPFQAESLLPFPLEETIVLPLIKKQGKRSTRTLLLAASQKSLEKHLSSCSLLSIDPDKVSSEPAALFHFSTHFLPKEKTFAYFHLGHEKLIYGMIVDREWKLSLNHPVGLQDFYKALALDAPEKTTEQLRTLAKEFDVFNIPSGRYPALHAFVQQLQKDLNRISSFLSKKLPEGELCRFFFTGDLDTAANWKEYLERHLGPSLESDKLTSSCLGHAIPIGLCLDAGHSEGFNFRQGNFAPLIKRKQKKLWAIIFASVSLLLNGLMGYSGHRVLQNKESQLFAKLDNYVKTYSQESSLSNTSFEIQLEEWERALTRFKKPFPYHSNAPKVSDLLAWISSHPLLKSDEAQKENRIEIKRVHYQLVKYPKLGESQDPYLTKAEIEFSSPSPRLAREFHDALLAGDELVNPKAEISWQVDQNGYETSFFLNPQKQPGNL